jgi:hypothetical protein
MCGLRVYHQQRSLSRSTLRATCSQVAPLVIGDEHGQVSHDLVKRCEITTHNVRKLRLGVGFDSVLFGAAEVQVDGLLLDLRRLRVQDAGQDILGYGESTAVYSGGQQFDRIEGSHFRPSSHHLDVCWSPPELPGSAAWEARLCDPESASSPLTEKSLSNYGPVRQLYARPFHIVYGTPQNQALRLAMKDLAVYLGNAHYAAHGTSVRVLSDLEYRTGNYARAGDMSNVLFVGGPSSNKLMKMVCANATSSRTGAGSVPILGRLPGDLQFSGGAEEGDYTFSLRNRLFDQPDQGVIFTLPLHRPSVVVPVNPSGNAKRSTGGAKLSSAQSSSSASSSAEQRGVTGMGVCVHANSAQGYLHLSRLAWPVVPPMVRAPFTTYLPDFMVTDQRVWSLGLGAVLAAGFWDHQWKVDERQSYFN